MATVFTVSQETPPAPPGDAWDNGGSSGGGGGGSYSYSAPAFEAYTKPLKSSDGTTIGRLEGKNFNSVIVWAEKNATISGVTYTLTVTGELSTQPPDNCWLDINFNPPDTSGLPKGMSDMLVLAVVKVTGNPADNWGYKENTLKYSLKISGASTEGLDPMGTYYLAKFDGTGYQVQKADGAGVSSNPISFMMSPPGDKGTFTVAEALSPTPTPAPTPTPTPTPAPSPTPLPETIGVTSIAIALVMFVLGAIATVAALYLVFLRGKA